MTDTPAKPRIQYVRSADGVRLAAWKAGAGLPLVLSPSYATDIQTDWEMPELAWYQRIAQQFTLVSYDRRGGGSSDRNVSDLSLDALVADLEAVVAWSGFRNFALIGAASSGPAAIAYAARHPDSVSHLVLFQTYARAADFLALPKIQAARALLAKDFKAFLEASLLFDQGWSDKETAETASLHFQEKITQEGMLAEYIHLEKIDVTGLLSRVEAPTLVFHRRRAPYPTLEMAKEIAAAIPNAQLVMLEGEKSATWDTDSAEMLDTIERFIQERVAGESAGQQDAELDQSGLTGREVDVLRLLAQGQSNKEIASDLSLSVHTVERHLANIYAKIGARGRTDAAAYAHKTGLT